MATFKVGDRVRVLRSEIDSELIGRVLEVEKIERTDIEPFGRVYLRGARGYWRGDTTHEGWLALEEGSWPTRFILQYELDKDPFETFSTMQEVEARIKELAKRTDLKRESIKVYEIAKTYDVTLETRVLFGPKVKLTANGKKRGRPAKKRGRGRPKGSKNKK